MGSSEFLGFLGFLGRRSEEPRNSEEPEELYPGVTILHVTFFDVIRRITMTVRRINHVTTLRRLLSVALVATCITAVQSEAAGKRRSAKHPSAPNAITAEISGTVIDDVTGQPVVGALVQAGTRRDTTGDDGKFELKGVTGAGSIDVVVSRTGYAEKHTAITSGGQQTVTIRLTPRATITVRKTDNTTVQIDDDSFEFGFSDAFNYRSSADQEFCRADGSEIVVKREEIARINGPATLVQVAPCCTANTVQKINVTLKAGGTQDLYFTDTCVLTRSMDAVGRDHVTGRKVFIPFSEIAEVIFP